MSELVMAKVMWAVFGDYDGNAPDTADLGVFPTKEEAEKVAAELGTLRDKEDDDSEEDTPADICEERDLIWPYVDGCQWCLSFRVREVLVRAETPA